MATNATLDGADRSAPPPNYRIVPWGNTGRHFWSLLDIDEMTNSDNYPSAAAAIEGAWDHYAYRQFRRRARAG